METNTKVCQMILQKIMEDPQSGSCLNLSYADVTGPVANFNPTGSPYATKSSNCGQQVKHFLNSVFICICLTNYFEVFENENYCIFYSFVKVL